MSDAPDAIPARDGRWQPEQVLALAPSPNSIAAAQPLAVPARWTGVGCDARAVWGRCAGGSSEPYDCVVDHRAVAFRCSCPSRRHPCKHLLALLLLWARGQVPEGVPSGAAAGWLAGRQATDETAGRERPSAEPTLPAAGSAGPASLPERDPAKDRDDRIARMMAGLADLDRWLDDRVRTGLSDPSLARYQTWDHVAARLVDAQVGGLANRVRRLAGVVGSSPDWHEHVLAELGTLHLLASAGRQLRVLPPTLADSVATALGWQVRQADVLGGVPHTDQWVVMGRSDTREDRIEVRRVYLRGRATGQWAMVLSFAAYQQRLDESVQVGSAFEADLFRYPGSLGLRALIGRRDESVTVGPPIGVCSLATACDEVGRALVAEPWVERYPVCVRAAFARAGSNGTAAWSLTDHTGSVPLIGATTMALACAQGRPVTLTAEWTPAGFVPLTVHLDDRTVDVGPVADPSFVGAA